MLFALTSALSALLLFWMQPLVARLVLPLFGGTPQVWTTSLLFFQVVLLCGYLLAHRLQKLPVRAQVAIQLSLLALALCFPLRLPADPPDAEGHGVGAVLLLLARMAGPGALALSVHAPLLQRWFARASPLRNPYPLYAASNVGSFLALAAFPFVLEPLLGISRQSTAWSGAYALLLLCVGACGLRAIRAPAADHSLLNDVDSSVNAQSAAQASAARAPASLTRPQRLRWMALAAVPTSLLSGVTAHLATDVASIPLLWILPLAIYLLTYIIAFAGPADSEGPKRLLLGAQAVALAVLVAIVPARSVQASLLVDLSAFGLTALLCHRELSRTKPAPALLTEFYLLISFGSVLGGAFNALVAPVVFVTVAEYPIALVAAVFLRPTDAPIFARVKTLLLECLGPALLTGLALVIVQQRGADTEVMHAALWKWLVFALGMATLFFAKRRMAHGLAIALALFFARQAYPDGTLLHRSRSFFGVHRVTDEDGFHWLHDGTTIHGAQNTSEEERTQPQTYYVREGPPGQVLAAMDALGTARHIGLVGLGTGAMACNLHKGQDATFFEIDPTMVDIAKNPLWFDYLARCTPDARIVMGDARLSLAREPVTYDLIVLDAFSSDSIPVHLLTREALQIYLAHLSPHGLLMFHTSNRFLRLERVLGPMFHDAHLVSRMQQYVPTKALEDDPNMLAYNSRWMVAARSAEDLGSIAADRRWLETRKTGRAWTDDHADVVSVMDFSP